MSTQWEAISLPRIPGCVIWLLVKPQHLPSGFSVMVPPEVLQLAAVNGILPFTLMDIVSAVGIMPQMLQAVSLFGSPWQPGPAWLNSLHSPLAAPGASGWAS